MNDLIAIKDCFNPCNSDKYGRQAGSIWFTE